jgi:hypothetical protein
VDRRRRPGRAWPALVGCRDVQIGPPAQGGNQLAREAVKQSGFQVARGVKQQARPLGAMTSLQSEETDLTFLNMPLGALGHCSSQRQWARS